MAVLFECHCSSHTRKPSIFNRLSVAPTSNLTKRRHSRKKWSFFDVQYPEVTSNMVGQNNTPSMSWEKQLDISSEKSNVETSLDLKEILIKPEGFYNGLKSGLVNSPGWLQCLGYGDWSKRWAPCYRIILIIQLLYREEGLCIYGRNSRRGG